MVSIHLVIGISTIILGIALIIFYQILKKEKKIGGLSFKLQTASIGAVILGISLIIRALFV